MISTEVARGWGGVEGLKDGFGGTAGPWRREGGDDVRTGTVTEGEGDGDLVSVLPKNSARV